MKVYVLDFEHESKIYSTKQKALNAYLQFLKNYYENYEKEISKLAREFSSSYYKDIPENHKQDLLNFLLGKSFEGIFTLDELNEVDIRARIIEKIVDE